MSTMTLIACDGCGALAAPGSGHPLPPAAWMSILGPATAAEAEKLPEIRLIMCQVPDLFLVAWHACSPACLPVLGERLSANPRR